MAFADDDLPAEINERLDELCDRLQIVLARVEFLRGGDYSYVEDE